MVVKLIRDQQDWIEAVTTPLTEPSEWTLRAGNYKSLSFRRTIDNHALIVRPETPANPPTIEALRLTGNDQDGLFRRLGNVAQAARLANITFDGLKFHAPRLLQVRLNGSPTGPIYRFQDDTDGTGYGWHMDPTIEGFVAYNGSKGGNMCGISGFENCTNIRITNCHFSGYQQGMKIRGVNGLYIGFNTVYQMHEDWAFIGGGTDITIEYNLCIDPKPISQRDAVALGRPSNEAPPHMDFVQLYGTTTRCIYQFNEVYDPTGRLHPLLAQLAANQSTFHRGLRVINNFANSTHGTQWWVAESDAPVVERNKGLKANNNHDTPILQINRNCPGAIGRYNRAPRLFLAQTAGVPASWTLVDNVETNSPSNMPPGWIEFRKDVAAAGNNRAGQYGKAGTQPTDSTRPSVTINKATSQADPATGGPVVFTVQFSEPVTGFTASDVTLSGTAGATTASVSSGGANYTVTVSGMTANGTVIASIPANVAQDAAGNLNTASTSTDNSVSWSQGGDTVRPSVTVNKSTSQADPVVGGAVFFTVVFSESVTGFTASDVNITGTAGATTASVTGSGTTYTVTVTGMTQTGTVQASVGAGAAQDAAGNTNTASTSTDNSVAWSLPASGEPPALQEGEIELVMIGDDSFGFTVPDGSPAEDCEIRWAYSTDATPQAPKLAKRTVLTDGVYVADSNDGSHLLSEEVQIVHVYYQGGPNGLPRSAISEVSWPVSIEGPIREAPGPLADTEWSFDPSNYLLSGEHVGVIRFTPDSPAYNATTVMWAGVDEEPKPTVDLGIANSGNHRWRMDEATGDYSLGSGETSPPVGVYYSTAALPGLSDRSETDKTYTRAAQSAKPPALAASEWDLDPTNNANPSVSGEYVGVIRFTSTSPAWTASSVWWAAPGGSPQACVDLGLNGAGTHHRWRMAGTLGDYSLLPGETSPHFGVYYATPTLTAMSDRSADNKFYSQPGGSGSGTWTRVGGATVLNTTANSSANPGGNYTASSDYTVVGGATNVLIACVILDQNAPGGTPEDDVTVTAEGVTMTPAVRKKHPGEVSDPWVGIFYLVNPTAGATTIVANTSTIVFRAGIIHVEEWSGGNVSSLIGNTLSDDDSASGLTTSFAASAADSLVVAAYGARDGDSSPFTPASGMTERTDQSTGTSDTNDIAGWVGTRISGSTSSVDYGATPTGSTTGRTFAAVEFKVGGGTPPPPPPPPDEDEFTATGGEESTVGGYKYHRFIESGTFTTTGANPDVEVLIVGGGGSGGLFRGGGGGGGGVRVQTGVTVNEGAHPIVVGQGGVAAPNGASGGNSSALGFTALGGGAGGGYDLGGSAGGSGGGGGGGVGGTLTGGPGSAGQGNRGGSGFLSSTNSQKRGGGGGGAGGPGGNATATQAGHGGAPQVLSWPDPAFYGAGGGGGTSAATGNGEGGDGGGDGGFQGGPAEDATQPE